MTSWRIERSWITLAVAGLLVASAPPAQKTWTVDLSGKGHFRSLATAVADSRVQDGDTLLIIKPPFYSYGGARTSKSLRFVGSPAGTKPSVSELTIDGATNAVVIENLYLDSVVIRRSRDITVTDCTITFRIPFLQKAAALIENNASVILRNCSVSVGLGRPACIAGGTQQTLWIVGSTLTGGMQTPLSPPFPALDLQSGRCIAAGASRFVAGAGTSGAPAIALDKAARLDVDPVVVLTPSGNAPPTKGGTVTKRSIPALQARGASPGKSIVTTLRSPSGHLAVLFAGAHNRGLVSPFGWLWVDPSRLFVLAAKIQDASQLWRFTMPVPSTLPLGMDLGIQALSGTTARLELTNHALILLRN